MKQQVKCDVFVYAVGRLNNWKLPQIAGLEEFKGKIVHTANWPKDLDVSGKNVAVIGNGSSALQCVAKIHKGEMRQPHPVQYPQRVRRANNYAYYRS